MSDFFKCTIFTAHFSDEVILNFKVETSLWILHKGKYVATNFLSIFYSKEPNIFSIKMVILKTHKYHSDDILML